MPCRTNSSTQRRYGPAAIRRFCGARPVARNDLPGFTPGKSIQSVGAPAQPTGCVGKLRGPHAVRRLHGAAALRRFCGARPVARNDLHGFPGQIYSIGRGPRTAHRLCGEATGPPCSPQTAWGNYGEHIQALLHRLRKQNRIHLNGGGLCIVIYAPAGAGGGRGPTAISGAALVCHRATGPKALPGHLVPLGLPGHKVLPVSPAPLAPPGLPDPRAPVECPAPVALPAPPGCKALPEPPAPLGLPGPKALPASPAPLVLPGLPGCKALPASPAQPGLPGFKALQAPPAQPGLPGPKALQAPPAPPVPLDHKAQFPTISLPLSSVFPSCSPMGASFCCSLPSPTPRATSPKPI